MSDVVDNSLDFIASGPTAPDITSPKQCLDLIDSMKVKSEVPKSITTFLQQLMVGGSETDTNNFHCNNAQNEIIANNIIAVDAAEQKAKKMGYAPFVLSTEIQGDAKVVGETFGKIANFVCMSIMAKAGKTDRRLVGTELDLVKSGISKKTINDLRTLAREGSNTDRPLCILGAGETTVEVTGKGKGGRNQEMALAAGIYMDRTLRLNGFTEHCTVGFMSGGTDGQDGPTDATGALADPELIQIANAYGLNPRRFLERNDSYNFFRVVKDGAYHVMTGYTGTNVMDVHVLLIRPNSWRTSLRGV